MDLIGGDDMKTDENPENKGWGPSAPLSNLELQNCRRENAVKVAADYPKYVQIARPHPLQGCAESCEDYFIIHRKCDFVQ